MILDTFSEGRFRKVRFATHFVDSKDELKSALAAKDVARAKQISRRILAFAEKIPEDNPALKLLHRVMATQEEETSTIKTCHEPQVDIPTT